MSRQLWQNDRGNSILTLLLFIPLGLVFLFGITQVALFMIDRSTIMDEVRSALNAKFASSKSDTLDRSSPEGISLSDRDLRLRIEHVAKEIGQSLANSLWIDDWQNSPRLHIEIRAVVLDIDPDSGAVLMASYPESLVVIAGNLSTSALSPKNQISEILKEDASSSRYPPSSFSIPIGYIHNLQDPSPKKQYVEKAIIIYAGVAAKPRSLAGKYIEALLGQPLVIINEQTNSPRNQLNY